MGFKGEERNKFPTGKEKVKGCQAEYGSTSVQPDRLECYINKTVSRGQS